MHSKTLRGLACLALACVLASCSEDKPTSPGNSAPADVQLSAPADAATGIAGALALSWQPAADPDGDAVTYTLYLDEDPDPATALATDIAGTSHSLAAALPIESTYYWRVTAADGQGGESTSPVRSFTTRDNEPPGDFELLGVPDGATGIEGAPTLSWAAATDPDGDAVAYDLYFDAGASPTTLLAADLSDLSYEVTATLGIETRYYWRVVAKDEYGAERSSAVFSFVTRALVSATEVTEDAGFPERSGHTSLVFAGKMWVIAGATCCGGRYDDVWSSSDGENWELAVEHAGFAPRNSHASVVHDGKMWVIGGYASAASEFTDVWSSTDGVTWTQVVADAGFGARYGLRADSFGGKIWIFGGRDLAGSYGRKQAWSSADGVTWTLENDDANFGGTSGMQVTEFQGALWKTGGQDDRVYRSTDGANWTVFAEDAAYGERYNHSCVVFDDKLWLMSGSNADNLYEEIPDVWFTSDGASWERAAADAGYQPVAQHSSLAFGGKMWIIAGGGGLGSSFVSNEVYALGY